MDSASAEPLLADYRLRTVRVAVLITYVAVVALALMPVLGPVSDFEPFAYGVMLGVGLIGATVAMALPWSRLFRAGWGERCLYVWSALDIVLVTVGASLTGGPTSDVIYFYALTTVFFAASYPGRGQIGLFGFTCISYLSLAFLWRPIPPAPLVFIRLATVTMVWIMAYWLAAERTREMAGHVRSRSLAEHRAALLSAVARTATAINTLDADAVLDGVTESLTTLGFDLANFCVLEPDGRSYVVAHAKGPVPIEYTSRPQSADHGMVALVRERGGTVVVHDYGTHVLAIPTLARLGVKVVIAAPVWVSSRLEAVLVGAKTEVAELSPTDSEAFELLAGQVGRALENAGRFQAQRRLTEVANRASVIDELTAVGNRRYANTLLSGLRPGDAVVLIDLDHFKDVNDRHGHAYGDLTLRNLAAYLMAGVRDGDEVARYGGEEFLLLLRQAGDTALAATERLLVGWRELDPITTFSAGVSIHGPDDTPEKSVGRADAAMYAAKQTGRDRVCEYGRGLEDHSTVR